ncbi:membrane protease subunit stomatin/prohibitin-like protein [Candidatus Magnetomorum sp. HK-1]|nr:membrane protease subunit stomatin/prohibitin-like protein [Candidatus Magnetomorum sp. HK-1]
MKSILKQTINYNKKLLIFLCLFSLLLIFFMGNKMFYSIKSGEAGVLWKRFSGTQIDYIYPEGFHIIFPWDEMFIYNIRIQEISPEINVLTKTGLEVYLSLSIRYAPKNQLLGLLHKYVGPDYANKVIVPEIEAVLREIIGTMGSEQIYTTGRTVIIEAINEAIEQVAQRYIQVDDVLIKRIELPASVAKAIRYKIEQKHLVEAHTFIIEKEKKEADRKRIEGKGIHDQLEIIAKALPDGKILKWKGIQATEKIAASNNAKVVIIGGGEDGLPIILNTESSQE